MIDEKKDKKMMIKEICIIFLKDIIWYKYAKKNNKEI